MSLLLAVEPDARQSAILKDIVRRQLSASLVIVRSKDEAVAAIERRVPDLILMSALVAPRDEAALNDHLRAMTGAEHVQTVSIPLLAQAAPRRARGGPFDSFTRKAGRKSAAESGCDPSVFGAEIAAYLKQAEDRRPQPPEPEEVDVDLAPSGVHESTSLTVDPEPVERVKGQAEDPEPAPLIPELTIAQETPARAPIALLEAHCHIEQPLIADEVFRSILEEMPMPQACLAGVVAPVGVEGFFRARRGPEKPTPLLSLAPNPVQRIELWHSLPLLVHVAPSLQGPEIREYAVVAAPVPVLPAPSPVSPLPGPEAPTPPPTPAVVVHAQPDEWGFYNPASCGFEALFETLDKLEKADKADRAARAPSATEVVKPERPKRKRKPEKPAVQLDRGSARDAGSVARGGPAHSRRLCEFNSGLSAGLARLRSLAGAQAAPRTAEAEVNELAPADVQPDAPTFSSVTDEILRSLRLPPHIAALSRPAGCRVTHVRTRRKAARRLAGVQRVPQPLIIVSKRLLELG